MRTLTLGLDYPKNDGKETPSELTVVYINYAVNSKYQEGLEGQMRRMWGRIQRKLDDAIDAKQDTVDLEESEFDFVKKSVLEAKFPPTTSKFINTLEDELDKKVEDNK